MTASSAQQPQPKVRSACENCHRRKIRCNIPASGGACQHCSSSGKECLFAPRIKAGRPRLSELAQRRSSSRPSNTAEAQKPQKAAGPASTTADSDDTPNSPPELSIHSPPSPSWSATDYPYMGAVPELDFDLNCNSPAFHSPAPTPALSFSQTSVDEQMVDYFSSHNAYGRSVGAGSSSTLTATIPAGSSPFELGKRSSLTSPINFAPTSNYLPTQQNSQASFDMFLRTCQSLNGHARLLQSASPGATKTNTSTAPATLASLEAATQLSSTAPPMPSSDDEASCRAMAVASLHKVLEIATSLLGGVSLDDTSAEMDAHLGQLHHPQSPRNLVGHNQAAISPVALSRCSSTSSSSHGSASGLSPADMERHTLKRLGRVLLQARLAASRLGEANLADRALTLRGWVDSMVGNNAGNAMQGLSIPSIEQQSMVGAYSNW